MTTPYAEIHWTCATLEEAEKIAKKLLEKGWVACANITPDITSLFVWKGALERQKEVKVAFKTRMDKFEAIRQFIVEQGSYEVPEITLFPIERGHVPYLAWIDEILTP